MVGEHSIPGWSQTARTDGLNGRDYADMSNDKAGEKRSEEHTSELQSHWYISYAVFCLKKKKKKKRTKKKNKNKKKKNKKQ